MHRQTPLGAGYVGYTGGGARTLIEGVNDSTMMQEMKGTMMHGEARDKVESPQNYGFSSVVRGATKGENGMIKDCAEGFMSFAGGNRAFAFCAVMDDRRYRPMGLKEGENTQYDDLGQMTLLRRAGVFVLSLDSPDDSQKQSGQSASTRDGSSGQTVQRFVSIRHVEKQQQKRNTQGSGSQAGSASVATQAAGQQQQDFKHEGDTVNNEVRVSKARIEFRTGDTVVGYYDKQSSTWYLTGSTIVMDGMVLLGGSDASAQVGILGSIDTAGDELVAGLATRANAK
jgi:phage gp45-like